MEGICSSFFKQDISAERKQLHMLQRKNYKVNPIEEYGVGLQYQIIKLCCHMERDPQVYPICEKYLNQTNHYQAYEY